MIRDILFPVTDARGDQAALDAAIAIAEHTDAHLAALVAVPLFVPVGFEWGAIPTDVYEKIHAERRAQGEKTAVELRQRLSRSTARSEVRVAETQLLPASRLAALHARHADLSVIASAAGDETPSTANSTFLDLLMDSGRPVLVVPPQHRMSLPLRRAVVAWQPTSEASRALHDALPLLRTAETVDVLTIDPRVGEDGHGQQPGADIAAHLARHGIVAQVVAMPSMGESVPAAILRHCVQSGADLVVAGGYSHSRFREYLLGGATRTLLESSPVPVLFSR